MARGDLEERIASIREAMNSSSEPRRQPPQSGAVIVHGNTNIIAFGQHHQTHSAYATRQDRAGHFTGVNWTQAPRHARSWAIDANGVAHWFCAPTIAPFATSWHSEPLLAPDFGFVGDWRDSYVERP